MAGPLNIQLIVYLLGLVEHVRNRERLLTEDEVAYIFQVDQKTIARWRKAGLIDYVTFEGSIIRYRWDHVDRRIASSERIAERLKAA